MTISIAEANRQNVMQVVSNYGKRLFSFIRNKVKSDEDAEDILQDVWYQLSNVVDTTNIEQMSAWLFTVARNKITDRYRKRSESLLEDFSVEDEEGTIHFKDLLLKADGDPESENLRELFWQELFKALEELPENQRQVFVWNELEDQTLQEIADKTGQNLKTVISRKGYAVKHLRNRLKNLYADVIGA